MMMHVLDNDGLDPDCLGKCDRLFVTMIELVRIFLLQIFIY